MPVIQIPQEFTGEIEDMRLGGSSKLVLVPEGKYQAMVAKSELAETSKGGTMLVLTVIITKGEYSGSEFIERLNIQNDNNVAVKIAFETLAKIAKAAGFAKVPQNTDQLNAKQLLITVKTEKGKPWKDNDDVEHEGSDRSVIKGYDPAPRVGVAVAIAAAQSNVQW